MTHLRIDGNDFNIAYATCVVDEGKLHFLVKAEEKMDVPEEHQYWGLAPKIIAEESPLSSLVAVGSKQSFSYKLDHDSDEGIDLYVHEFEDIISAKGTLSTDGRQFVIQMEGVAEILGRKVDISLETALKLVEDSLYE